MFLELKNDEVTIKGRGFGDGRKNRDWLSKEDTSSPTMSNKVLMLLCMIDAMEGDKYTVVLQLLGTSC